MNLKCSTSDAGHRPCTCKLQLDTTEVDQLVAECRRRGATIQKSQASGERWFVLTSTYGYGNDEHFRRVVLARIAAAGDGEFRRAGLLR